MRWLEVERLFKRPAQRPNDVRQIRTNPRDVRDIVIGALLFVAIVVLYWIVRWLA